MENIFYGLIVILLLANLYFVTRKETEEDNKDDEYLIKGIVSEIMKMKNLKYTNCSIDLIRQ